MVAATTRTRRFCTWLRPMVLLQSVYRLYVQACLNRTLAEYEVLPPPCKEAAEGTSFPLFACMKWVAHMPHGMYVVLNSANLSEGISGRQAGHNFAKYQCAGLSKERKQKG